MSNKIQTIGDWFWTESCFVGVFSQLRTVTCKDFQSSFKKFRTFSCNNKIGFQDSSKTINCSKCTNHDPCNVMSLLLKDYFVVRRVNSTRFDSKNTWHVCSCAVKMGGGGGGERTGQEIWKTIKYPVTSLATYFRETSR